MQIINLIGHIGRDAETKHIGERDYISFSVACTEKRGNEETTSWYSILYPYQEAVFPFLKKGQQVFVMGRLSAKIYQSNNSFGIDLSVFAQTLQLCGGKREEGQQAQQQAQTMSNGITGTTAAAQPGSNGLPSGQTVIYPDRDPSPFPPLQPEAEEDPLPF